MPPIETPTALRLTRQRARSIAQKPAVTPLGVRSTNRMQHNTVTVTVKTDKAALKVCLPRRHQSVNKENVATGVACVEMPTSNSNSINNNSNKKEPLVKKELELLTKQTENKPLVGEKRVTAPVSPFYAAKQVLTRSVAATKIIGRVEERALYISGQPGTGKTALLTEIVKEMDQEMTTTTKQQGMRKIYLNCMSLVDPKDVYRRLLESLPNSCVGNGISLDDPVQAMRQIVLGERRKTLIVVILDEIDHLLTKDQNVLYRLFEWAAQPNAHLVLVGIANALDLTERFLPLLCAKNCEPQLLNFNPYSVNDIIGILNERLQEATQSTDKTATEKSDKSLLIQRTAIELCARKVASATGDLRKAMDVFRQAIELAEHDYMTKQRAAQSSASTKSSTPLKAIATPQPSVSAPVSVSAPLAEPRPSVTVSHMLKVLSGVFGSASVQVIRTIGFQQKLVLGAFLRLSEAHRRRDATVGQLFDAYLSLCQSQKAITPVTRSEFYDLLGMLEASNGLVTFGKRHLQEERTQRIQLNAQPDDIRLAFRNEALLQQMLDGMVIRPLI
ncbi:P-loop containing nucleoside triphosphate hydrolase protein [Syncephalis fuscata]|nr:P-loop containing nucleoside triphosphate hydrolase protein [Syncephalis fuscata]